MIRPERHQKSTKSPPNDFQTHSPPCRESNDPPVRVHFGRMRKFLEKVWTELLRDGPEVVATRR